MDTTNVVSWSIHEKWVDTLFRAYSSESSAATRPVSLTRVLNLSTAKKKRARRLFSPHGHFWWYFVVVKWRQVSRLLQPSRELE